MDNLSILKSYSPLEKVAIDAANQRDNDQGAQRHPFKREHLIFSTADAGFLKWALTTGLGFKPLRRCLDGRVDIGYIINVRDQHGIMPFLVREKSVLFLHSYNARDVPQARLIHLAFDGKEDLGLFVQINEKEALSLPAWTYDPMQNTYFTCKRL